MTLYVLKDAFLEQWKGAERLPFQADDMRLTELDGLFVQVSGELAQPLWLVPQAHHPDDGPPENWSIGLARARTTEELLAYAAKLTPPQAALLFATLPDRLLQEWTGAFDWPAPLAEQLHHTVMTRFAQTFSAGDLHEVWPDQATQLPPLTLSRLSWVPAPAAAARPTQAVALGQLALPPNVTAALHGSGGTPIIQLYLHQALALAFIRQSQKDGRDLILATPTASGKTLAFLPGILEALLQGSGTALFLYPLKALSHDQHESIQGYVDALPGQPLRLKRFFGTDQPEPGEAPPRLMVATPDKLNYFLDRPELTPFFQELRFIVLDEAHSYRGAFGSHMSAFLRRLLLVSGSQPTLILSSATVRNTLSFAQKLTGRSQFRVVGQSTAPAYPRHLYLSPVPNGASHTSQAHRPAIRSLAQHVRQQGRKGIVFVSSRSQTRTLATSLHQAGDPADSPVVFPFFSNMNGYTERLQQLKHAPGPAIAVSTSTLEAGVDIGDLDVVAIAGFPRNRNSFKQMAGRAGRRGTAHVTFLPGTSPADQYFSRPDHLARLMTAGEAEPVYLNPYNLTVLRPHVARLRYELGRARGLDGLSVLREAFPESLPAAVRSQLEAGLQDLFEQPVHYVPAPPLRGESGMPHVVIRTGQSGDPDSSLPCVEWPEESVDWGIERCSLDNAYREWGPGNVVMRGDRFFRVLDWKAGEITAERHTKKAVLIWVQEVTDQVASPIHLAEAARGLRTLAPGTTAPHFHTASLRARVVLEEVMAEYPGHFIRARSGRGTVSLEVLGFRERHTQTVRAHCPGARPVHLQDQLRSRFQVKARDESGEILLQIHPETQWPTWRAGEVVLSAPGDHARRAYVAEEFRTGSGLPTVVVRLHEHDDQIPQTCSCGRATMATLEWTPSLEDVPPSWSAHPVFQMVPRTFPSDVAELTFEGASLPAFKALLSAVLKALPDVLHIDAQELGAAAVSESGVVTLLLWDTAEGGMGISLMVAERFAEILAQAQNLLEECLTCSCEGQGCFGCIETFSPVPWEHRPAKPKQEDGDPSLLKPASDEALIFLNQVLDRGEWTPQAVDGTSPLPAFEFTGLFISLEVLQRGIAPLLDRLMKSSLEITVVSDLDLAGTARALGTCVPAWADRLTGTALTGVGQRGADELRRRVEGLPAEKLLWLVGSEIELELGRRFNLVTALALWVSGALLPLGPDLVLEMPEALLGALTHSRRFAWPLEQAGLAAPERSAPRTMTRQIEGDTFEVTVLGRYFNRKAAFTLHSRPAHATAALLSFKDVGTAARDLAELVALHFPHRVVVCIPSSKTGLPGAGLEALSSQLRRLGHPVLGPLTWATKPESSQKAAGSVKERIANVRNCFAAPESPLQGRDVLLIDDVVTSGASLWAARQVLMQAGADVACLAVAHTVRT